MMHMFETGTDDKISRERNGKSAIRHYEESGLLGADLLAVHSVAIGEEEISTYARNHVSVSYNPNSQYVSCSRAWALWEKC